MSTLTAPRRATRHTGPMPGRGLRVGSAVLLLVVGYVALTFGQVWFATREDAVRPAQAIVVLGAAQYNGRPSPVLEGRLRHVADLYRRDIAPLVVVTGGGQEEDDFTEAAASASWLADNGVPGGAIERETTGSTSYESLAATARFLAERGVSEVVLVSDPFHAYRIGAIAEEVGMNATVSPTPHSPIDGAEEWRHLVRETAAVSVGRLLGYRRLDHALDGE
jgi:uncharacterized SAM-binding protein YcdF (DUF218 family)